MKAIYAEPLFRAIRGSSAYWQPCISLTLLRLLVVGMCHWTNGLLVRQYHAVTVATLATVQLELLQLTTCLMPRLSLTRQGLRQRNFMVLSKCIQVSTGCLIPEPLAVAVPSSFLMLNMH